MPFLLTSERSWLVYVSILSSINKLLTLNLQVTVGEVNLFLYLARLLTYWKPRQKTHGGTFLLLSGGLFTVFCFSMSVAYSLLDLSSPARTMSFLWRQNQRLAQQQVPLLSQLLWYAQFKLMHWVSVWFISRKVGIKVLNHVINGAILIFVMSAANSDLYIGSRTLYGLAVQGQAPKIFRRVNRMGVPYPALLLCTAFCALVFLNVSSSSAKGKMHHILQFHVWPFCYSVHLVC